MDSIQASEAIQQMIKFIENEAEEREKELQKKGDAEYTAGILAFILESDALMTTAFAKIKEEYKGKMEQYQIQKQIENSAKLNALRLKKMTARNKLIEQVLLQAKDRLAEYFQDNKEDYKKLVKTLLLQGLIKLLETKVEIEVRKEDVSLIEGLIPDVIKEYVELLKTNVKSLEGKDIKATVKINQKRYLPQGPHKGQTGPSCVGGIILRAHKGKIVCANTIDERLTLCFQQAIPEIRDLLFPPK